MFGDAGRNLQGRAKADYLVAEIGKRVHVRDARLDADDDRSFGEFGFKYAPRRKILTSRVIVAKAYFDKSPEISENFRKVGRALNDPKIGGLFEQGGGYFLLDEKEERYFLMKDFPVETTDSKKLWSQLEEQMDLGGRWTFKWFGRVADITHGHEQPPTHPVTRKNDPYPPG